MLWVLGLCRVALYEAPSDRPYRRVECRRFVEAEAADDEETALRAELPFTGGAIGYFGYDLARRYERLPALATDLERLPEMAVGIYDWAVVVDHSERRTWLAGQGRWHLAPRQFGLLPRRAKAGRF